jgi:ribosomal-protein-alanine N-acetyltransferase
VIAIREATRVDAASLAKLHAASFDTPWEADEIAALLAAPGGLGLLAHDAGEDTGFLLARTAADEAEILTVAVLPHRRRLGTGRALVQAASEAVRTAGAALLYLEVAADDAAALALYEAAGFVRAGVRRRYYTRRDGERADALVLRLPLEPASA